MKTALFSAILAVMLASTAALAKPGKPAPKSRAVQARKAAPWAAARAPAAAARTPAFAGGSVKEVDKPLQVTGQSRNLSMMLVLKNDKDKLKFVEVRRSYRDHIPNTRY